MLLLLLISWGVWNCQLFIYFIQSIFKGFGCRKQRFLRKYFVKRRRCVLSSLIYTQFYIMKFFSFPCMTHQNFSLTCLQELILKTTLTVIHCLKGNSPFKICTSSVTATTDLLHTNNTYAGCMEKQVKEIKKLYHNVSFVLLAKNYLRKVCSFFEIHRKLIRFLENGCRQ